MEKMEKLAELFQEYELAKLGREINEQRFKDAGNKVLAENMFMAAYSCDRCEVKKGDRITDEEMTFLMDTSTHKKYLELYIAECQKQGLTDSEGKIIENWLMLFIKTKKRLVDYIIEYMVPQELKEQIAKVKGNVIRENKLIEIYKNLFTKHVEKGEIQ